MIPKIIHYFWAGSKDYPDSIQKCIDSWKWLLQDYQIIKWDETSEVINNNRFAKEALRCKKYAFVADYMRLYALYNFGGIYMDTDVQVFKSFDDLLNERAFSGFESRKDVGVWLLASEKENPIFKDMLDLYESKRFIKDDGSYDMLPNPLVLKSVFKKYGFKLNGELQRNEYMTIFPMEYFCPLNPSNGIVEITRHTYAMHLFDGSWMTEKDRRRISLSHCYYGKLSKIMPSDIAIIFGKLIAAMEVGGIKNIIEKIIEKIKRL